MGSDFDCLLAIEIEPGQWVSLDEKPNRDSVSEQIEKLCEDLADRQPAACRLLNALQKDICTHASKAGRNYHSRDDYDAWLHAEEDPLFCTLTTVAGRRQLGLRQSVGPDDQVLSRLEFLARLAVPFSAPLRATWFPCAALNGAAFVASKALFRQGRLGEAKNLLEAQMHSQRSLMLEPALRVVELALGGQPIPPHLEDVFGNSDYFKGRFCTLPFYEATIDVDGHVFICCPSYLNLPVGNIRTAGVGDILNSEVAKDIRRSILDGSFRYCDRVACSFIAGNTLPSLDEAREHPFFAQVIDDQSVELDRVHRVSLALDRTCNLSCPSCRTEVIIEKGEALDWRMQATRDVVLPLLKKVETLQMNGYGEFAMSEPCRLILEKVNPQEYPNLQFDLITNGLLFDRGFWNRYPNIHTMIRQVRVSIDGATKPTYEKLRRGGEFEKIRRNLEFLAELRRMGSIPTLSILFVYQAENFREMKQMVEWASSLGCDNLHFEKILNWGSFGPTESYRRNAVHDPAHADYAEFRRLVEDPIFQRSIVVRDWDSQNTGVDPKHIAHLPLVISGSGLAADLTFGSAAAVERAGSDLGSRSPPLLALLEGIGTELRRQPTCSYDAVAHFDRWLDAGVDGIAYSTVSDPSGKTYATVRIGDPGDPADSVAKARWLIQLNALKTHTYLHGALFAAARCLFRAGHAAEAHLALSAQATREHHFLNMPALRVTELTLSGQPIPEPLEDVFGQSDYFLRRFCGRPFTEMAVEAGRGLFACHSHFLNLPVGSIAQGPDAALNSDMAVKIRQSVLDGSFRYCNRLHCADMRNGTLPTVEEARRDPALRRVMDERATTLSRLNRIVMPLPFVVSLDPAQPPLQFLEMDRLESEADRLQQDWPATASLLRALAHDVRLRDDAEDGSWIAHYRDWLNAKDDPLVCSELQLSDCGPPLLALVPGDGARASVEAKAGFLLRLNSDRAPIPDVGLYQPYLVGAVVAAAAALAEAGCVEAALQALEAQVLRSDPALMAALRATRAGRPSLEGERDFLAGGPVPIRENAAAGE